MPEIKIFVDIKEDTTNTIVISISNAKKLGVSEGSSIEVFNPENGRGSFGTVKLSESALDFAGSISKNIIDTIQFAGIEVILKPSSAASPVSYIPPPTPAYQPSPIHQPTSTKTMAPKRPEIASKPVQPTPTYQPSQPPKITALHKPTSITSSPPKFTPLPQSMPTPPPQSMQVPSPYPPAPRISAPTTVEPYPNKIDANALANQRRGLVLVPVIDNTIEGGRVQLSPNILNRLGLGHGMIIAWEDPWTRASGSARINQANISDAEIKMSTETKEDTNVQANQIVIYSTEPPIQKASQVMLEVQSQPGLEGFCLASPRTQYTLSIQNDDVIAFEDELTGAVGAAKVRISETATDKAIIIDTEILEASGIGSFEVKVSKNQRQILPLQSVSLGISPISGENMWEIIKNARQNIDSLKNWLSNYVIFKGIKLRWQTVNIACSILNCVPDLTGDILAQITHNTTITLSPTGLIPFNAILIIDISRSMMARDVLITNIAPAIEGIKAAMESREIQEFLKNFKDGVNVPRRISAAFAAVLFLSEKVGRGFGEKVAIIRFADEAQILPLGETFFMDSASGKKGILEEASRIIVDRIGNAYGQATNMGAAMQQAHLILNEFEKINSNQPTMIVLLTDGVPTDGNAFFDEIKLFANEPNVVIYVVGLGNPDDELMTRAASLCGGEYFKPDNAGDLLIWYSKRARDLTVKLKTHKK